MVQVMRETLAFLCMTTDYLDGFCGMAQVMRETLAFLCMTHGSIAAYLQACGFDGAAQAQLASDLAPGEDASAPQG